MPRMSTWPVSLSCWQPILVAMKQPVRPIPALRDRHSSAEHQQTAPAACPCSCSAACPPALLCCCAFFLEGCWVLAPGARPSFLARHQKPRAGVTLPWQRVLAVLHSLAEAALEAQNRSVPHPWAVHGALQPLPLPAGL